MTAETDLDPSQNKEQLSLVCVLLLLMAMVFVRIILPAWALSGFVELGVSIFLCNKNSHGPLHKKWRQSR